MSGERLRLARPRSHIGDRVAGGCRTCLSSLARALHAVADPDEAAGAGWAFLLLAIGCPGELTPVGAVMQRAAAWKRTRLELQPQCLAKGLEGGKLRRLIYMSLT